MPDDRYLLIMAKEPVPGGVKTRMVPPLSPEEAARVYEALLLDTVEMVADLPGVTQGLAYTPVTAEPYFRRVVPEDWYLTAQAGGDLGEKITAAFEGLFSLGAGAVCLLNSDGPDLPPENISTAFEWLSSGKADTVFGPNPDGGYYLVGLKRPADIFRGIPWSTDRVLAVNIFRAGEAGLKIKILPPWPDLDSVEELRRALDRWKSGKVLPPPRSFRAVTAILDRLPP